MFMVYKLYMPHSGVLWTLRIRVSHFLSASKLGTELLISDASLIAEASHDVAMLSPSHSPFTPSSIVAVSQGSQGFQTSLPGSQKYVKEWSKTPPKTANKAVILHVSGVQVGEVPASFKCGSLIGASGSCRITHGTTLSEQPNQIRCLNERQLALETWVMDF